MMNYNYSRILCIKSITGNIQKNEIKKLEDWLLISDENRKVYQNMNDLWRNSIPKQAPIIPDVDEEWLALSNRIENKTELSMSFKKIHKYQLPSLFTTGIRFKPIYAGAIITLIIAFALFFMLKQNPPVSKNVIFVSKQSNRTVQLPDGSTVLLNSISHLEYAEPFNEKIREVKLKGEGYFSVIHEKRPFVITTDNARITVVGTKFDVKSNDDKTSVVVREGHVKLSQNRGNLKEVDLLIGQKSTVIKDQEPCIPVTVNADYLLEWMKGKFVYDRTPLFEIFDDLQKYYNVKINFSDDNIKPITLTGTFSKDNLENILSAICIANGLNYKKVNGEYLII
jgi:ferric-dicitrate binding protein FerR (iron transport regulator)